MTQKAEQVIVADMPIGTLRTRWLVHGIVAGLILVVTAGGWVLAGRVSGVPVFFIPAFLVMSALIYKRADEQAEHLRELAGASRSGEGLAAAQFQARSMKQLVGSVARLLFFVEQLVHALLPLALFAFAVVFFASAGEAWWKQVLAGVIVAELLSFVSQAERADARRAWRWGRWMVSHRRVPFLVALLTVGTVIAVYGVLNATQQRTIEAFENIGGPITALSTIALLVTTVGITLRVTAVAVSALRIMFALLLGLAAATAALKAGLLPGSAVVKHVAWWRVAGVVALFALLVSLWEWKQGVPEVTPAQEPAGGASRGEKLRYVWASLKPIGYFLAVVGAGIFLVAVAIGSITSSEASGRADRWATTSPGAPTKPPKAMTDKELAIAFAPMLELSNHENWPLGNAARFLSSRDVKPYRPKPNEQLPQKCRGTRQLCFVASCDASLTNCQSTHRLPPGRYVQGVAYAMVSRARNKSDMFRFDSPNPFGRELTTLIQYWLFYPYDKWQSLTLGGIVTQQHEGDWEAVTVGLSNTAPLFVAYSQHCGGDWVRWDKIDVARNVDPRWKYFDQASQANLHPVVAVAQGSHANYLHSWNGRAPDWGSCGPNVRHEIVNALSYAWNLRDRTSDAVAITPRQIRVVTGATPVMNFPGYWGATDRVTLTNFRHPDRPIGKPGKGPTSPAFHTLWQQPVHEIFCGKFWRPSGQCADPATLAASKRTETMTKETGFAQLIGAAGFGLVLGWCLCWVLFRAQHIGLKDLALVVAAVGGAALTKLFPDRLFGYYCIGVGVGFLLSFAIISAVAIRRRRFTDALLGRS